MSFTNRIKLCKIGKDIRFMFRSNKRLRYLQNIIKKEVDRIEQSNTKRLNKYAALKEWKRNYEEICIKDLGKLKNYLSFIGFRAVKED